MLRPYQKYIKFKDLGEEDTGPQKGGEEQKKKEEPGFQAFAGKGHTLAGSAEKSKPAAKETADPEMEDAMYLSQAMFISELESRIPKEPAPGDPHAVTLSLRLPDGRNAKRSFAKSDTLGDVANFCKVQLTTTKDVKLICAYPRRPYEDMRMAVGAAFSQDAMVIVELAK